MSYISINNVSKAFGNVKALENVSLSIEKDEIYGLLGPNGAGNSTLISIMASIISADSGNIVINGFDIQKSGSKLRKMIGLVPQEIALYPTLTAVENLRFWGKMYGLSGKSLKKSVERVLDIAGLKDRAKDRIDKYSGGMKRRINIAAALLHEPEVIIMDEPTVGIDPQSRNHILETVLELNKGGLTVIYTSHYMEEVEYLCSKIGIIDHGEVIANGTKKELANLLGDKATINIDLKGFDDQYPKELENMPEVEKVTVEKNKIKIITKNVNVPLTKYLNIIEKDGAKVHAVDIEEKNLESVFLHLTGRALRD